MNKSNVLYNVSVKAYHLRGLNTFFGLHFMQMTFIYVSISGIILLLYLRCTKLYNCMLVIVPITNVNSYFSTYMYYVLILFGRKNKI